MATCTALVCGVQCTMPVRHGHWQSQTSNVCSEMTGQWSDRSAVSSRKTLSPPDQLSYLRSLALRSWTSFWRREGYAGIDMWNAPMMQSRQPLTHRLMESMGLGGQRWHGSSCHKICHKCSKPATWKGDHWCGCCPCTCMLIKNLLMMMMMMMMMVMMMWSYVSFW